MLNTGHYTWKVVSKNIFSDEDLEKWLQEMSEKYIFYQLKLYEDRSVRLICREWVLDVNR